MKRGQTLSFELFFAIGIFFLTISFFFTMIGSREEQTLLSKEHDLFVNKLLSQEMFNDNTLGFYEFHELSSKTCEELSDEYNLGQNWIMYFRKGEQGAVDIRYSDDVPYDQPTYDPQFCFGCGGAVLSGFDCGYRNEPTYDFDRSGAPSALGCQPDCTQAGRDTIDESCNGQNGCEFYTRLSNVDPFNGRSTRYMCDGKPLGWAKPLRVTDATGPGTPIYGTNTVCGDYFEYEVDHPFFLTLPEDARFSQTTERFVRFRGEQVKFLITTWKN